MAPTPLVAGLPPSPEAPTQRCNPLFFPLNRHHEAHPLIHGTGLHPSHRQAPPRRSVELSPMSSVYSVTHVAGLDPLPTLPLQGRVKKATCPRVVSDRGAFARRRHALALV